MFKLPVFSRFFHPLLVSICFVANVHSQEVVAGDSARYDSVSYKYIGVIYLDSVVVTASKKGFDVDDFIRMVTTDNTFYRAFKNLRFADYYFKNNIKFYKKNGLLKASYKSINHQKFEDNCRSMEVNEQIENKNFYKGNNKNKFYTAKMYERIFYTQGTICNEDTTVSTDFFTKSQDKIEEYISELKKFVFSPGQEVDVPFIGKKMQIFSSKMSKYYTFSIQHIKYQDTLPCYLFSAVVKPEFEDRNKTIIKYLHTYFAKNSLQIIARKYHLSYKNFFYDFDVKMDVRLKKKKKKYFPVDIRYNGIWDIVFKKEENCAFRTQIYDIR